MNARLCRAVDRVWSLVTALLLLTVSVCANAQTSATMAIAGGNNQSAYTGQNLPDLLSVSFSGASYVTLDWTATGGATFDTNGGSTYTASEIDTETARTR